MSNYKQWLSNNAYATTVAGCQKNNSNAGAGGAKAAIADDTSGRPGAVHGTTQFTGGLGVFVQPRTQGFEITELHPESQLKAQKIKVGDVIVGINGVRLASCMENPSDRQEFQNMLNVCKMPYHLNFNQLAGGPVRGPNVGQMLKMGVPCTKIHQTKQGVPLKAKSYAATLQVDNGYVYVYRTNNAAHKKKHTYALNDLENVSEYSTKPNGCQLKFKAKNGKSDYIVIDNVQRVKNEPVHRWLLAFLPQPLKQLATKGAAPTTIKKGPVIHGPKETHGGKTKTCF